MGAWDTPTAKCPYCGTECECDWIDVDVGLIQCGPYFCIECHASQIGPYDTKRLLTEREKSTGWYEPNTPVSETANTYKGKLVGHQLAKALYRQGKLDPK